MFRKVSVGGASRPWQATMSARAWARRVRSTLIWITSALYSIAMPSTTAAESLCSFPPFPAPPEGVTIVPFGAFVPAGYRRGTDPSGDPIEVDAWMGIPTVKVLSDKEATQKRKAKKKQRNAGNAVDAEGRLIPWWEEWEVGEALRAVSEPSFDDGYVFVRWFTSITGLTR